MDIGNELLATLSQKSGLPQSLNYLDVKPSAMSAISKRIEYPSMNSTYGPSDVARIKIPTGVYGEFLDCQQSYLRIKITNSTVTDAPAATSVKLDNNIACVIKKFELYGLNGSQLLYSLDNYNVANILLREIKESGAERTSFNSLLVGSLYSNNTNIGAELAEDASATYIHIPICPVLSSKLLPIGQIAQDLEIRITFETAQNALVCTNNTDVPGYSISDLAYIGQVVQCDSSTTEAILAQNNGMFVWKDSGFYHHFASWDNASSQNRFLLPYKFSSLRTVYVTKRHSGQIAVNKKSLSSRTMCEDTDGYSYYFQVGSQLVPQRAINVSETNLAEHCCECLRAIHALNDLSHASGVNSSNFAIVGAADNGKHFVATEMESFSHDTLTNGSDTVNSNVYYNETWNSAASAAYYFDFYAEYDCITVITPDGNIQTNQ
jgi:hypothetical protein